MPKQVNIQKLQLPLPARLVTGEDRAFDTAVQADVLSKFLEGGLADSASIASWIREHAAEMADLPGLAEREQLSARHRIYDHYFGVCRHGGTTSTITFALAQVMEEVSRELAMGSGLDQRDLNRLLDGLAAVLEATGEC